MKSVFKQQDGECFICNMLGNYVFYSYLEEHHIFFGTSNRKKSEKFGLKVKLCPPHHRTSNEAVHMNYKMDLTLKEIGQKKFEETYAREKFRKEFGKSWL